ncbi:MAG: monovalent cation/H+ antiporter complex subunit F [bacterium]|nr:monovalent cation/H+ antiporter complex subunit F [bacterium]
MTSYVAAVSLVLLVLVFLCLWRAARGPTVADRVVAINVIATKTMVLIALISSFFGEGFFLDVALVYALIGFLATVGVAKYLEGSA